MATNNETDSREKAKTENQLKLNISDTQSNAIRPETDSGVFLRI